MSAAASRRNGKPASCETCRKGKIRCDHQRPVCGRCRQRGLDARCYYHPAPLTKPREAVNRTAQSKGSHDSNAVQQLGFTAVEPNIDNFPVNRDLLTTSTSGDKLSESASLGFDLGLRRSRENQLNAVTQILGLLRYSDSIDKLTTAYREQSSVPIIPGPMLKYATTSLLETWPALLNGNASHIHDRFRQTAEDVLESTSRPIKVTQALHWKDYIDMFTGENLRLEIIGIVYAISIRTYIFGIQVPLDVHREQFLGTMFDATCCCLELARSLNPEGNDAMLWLSTEVLRTTSNMRGDTHPDVWTRLGETSCDLYALELNRDIKNTTNNPFWLADLRRRSFCFIQGFDKFVATLFDRPPRVTTRYSDCRLPLDLSDDELLSDEQQLEEARAKLTPDGWNTDSRYFSATFARLRSIISSIREDIMEYSYRPSTSQNIAQLKELSIRCRKTVQDLPPRLQYSHDLWYSEISASDCLTLGVGYLLFLQSDFHIHRMLERNDVAFHGAFLSIAFEIVDAVVQMGNVRDRAIFLRMDNSYVMLTYGLPAAAVLIDALSKVGNKGLPNGLGRSKVIRNLSVFISYLESICTREEANYTVCTQAARVFARRLDDVLETPVGSSVASIGPATPISADLALIVPNARADSPTRSIQAGSDFPADIDMVNAEGWENFDLDAWIKTIDWSGTANWAI